jgi:hypothetical protein
MQAFPDYGLLALNVIQDERSNGAKPGPESYSLDTRDGKTIEQGPAGGWCTCFRQSDYRKLWLRMLLRPWSMKAGEDSFLQNNFRKKLSLKGGIIREAVCFHACGPYYAREYGHLEREIEKYTISGLQSFVDHYSKYRDQPRS